MKNHIIVSAVFLTFISSATFASVQVDQSLLVGDWCYQSITARDSSTPQEKNTNWNFSADGKVQVQSAWKRTVVTTVPYEIKGDRILISKMNEKYITESLSDTEMILISAVGSAKNVFSKGVCEE